VESAHKIEETGEAVSRMAEHSARTRKLMLHRQAARDDTRRSGSPKGRQQQKRTIKKQYAAVRRQSQADGMASAGSAVNTAEFTAKRSNNRASHFARRHSKVLGIVITLFLVTALILGIMSSCSMLLEGGLSALSGSTFPGRDADMLAAEAAYAGMEAELQSTLDHYESTHSYDAYSYELDEIKHDPYVLTSILSAMYGAYTLEDVEGTLEALFNRQYTLSESVLTETRYDDDGEPYSYTICTVTLENADLSHLPVYIMGEDQLSRYAAYMSTLGSRPDLFPTTQYPNASERKEYLDYDVPPEALADERFAAMLAEAEKYLGYPYVWGGSSPSTSFDCSGYISWVVNHSGWNVGRLGATGLYHICTPVSAADARPGDLVFFEQTFKCNTPVSHVGLYVGNGMMIHCGSPISYANLNSRYWQEHLFCYGRLP